MQACEDSSLWFDGEPCTGQDRWTNQLLAPVFPWKPQRDGLFSHVSCLRPRYTRLLDGPFCEFGNEIYAWDPRICRHMVAINAPFSPFSPSPLPNSMVCSRLSVLGLFHSSVCHTPLSRQPRFTQQHEALRVEGRPSSVNTWLSLHVHSHLIMGEALISE